jgi:Flp pilus assembly pilin Flp
VTLWRLLRDECGATIAEYAMVLGWFAIAAMVGFGVIAVNANNAYSSSTSKMTDVEENPLPTVVP